jgi:hypothetical protein
MRQRAAEDLFDEIRVLPEEARESAIEAGSDDPWVRAEVRSLLRFDGPTVPTHGYGHGPARAPGFDAESCIGLSAGGFTLRRVIGVGGMGTVFEADQELPSRKIAVKVLHAATMRASALARFARRQRPRRQRRGHEPCHLREEPHEPGGTLVRHARRRQRAPDAAQGPERGLVRVGARPWAACMACTSRRR